MKKPTWVSSLYDWFFTKFKKQDLKKVDKEQYIVVEIPEGQLPNIMEKFEEEEKDESKESTNDDKGRANT